MDRGEGAGDKMGKRERERDAPMQLRITEYRPFLSCKWEYVGVCAQAGEAVMVNTRSKTTLSGGVNSASDVQGMSSFCSPRVRACVRVHVRAL